MWRLRRCRPAVLRRLDVQPRDARVHCGNVRAVRWPTAARVWRNDVCWRSMQRQRHLRARGSDRQQRRTVPQWRLRDVRRPRSAVLCELDVLGWRVLRRHHLRGERNDVWPAARAVHERRLLDVWWLGPAVLQRRRQPGRLLHGLGARVRAEHLLDVRRGGSTVLPRQRVRRGRLLRQQHQPLRRCGPHVQWADRRLRERRLPEWSVRSSGPACVRRRRRVYGALHGRRRRSVRRMWRCRPTLLQWAGRRLLRSRRSVRQQQPVRGVWRRWPALLSRALLQRHRGVPGRLGALPVNEAPSFRC